MTRGRNAPDSKAAGRRPATFALLLLITTTAAVAQDPTLDRRHADFLDAVDPILSDTERRVFGELRHAYQRDAFMQRFWAVRDPFPETPQNEFRERFEQAVETAVERFGDARDDRFESLLLHGEPLRTFRTTCDLLRTLDVWHYPHSPAVGGEFYLIFLRQGGGFRLWKAADGFSSLLAFATVSTDRDAQLREINRRCSRGGDLLSAFGLALDWQAIGAEAPEPGRANDEWALAFLDRSTETPDGAEALPAGITLRYPGRRGNRTVVQAIVGIDPAHLPEPGDEARRFVLDGEVLRRGELFESFRYRFEPPARTAGSDAAASIPLVTQRYLRPGPYRLVVKVRELEADRFFGGSTEIEVPLVARSEAGDVSPPPAAAAGQKTRAPSGSHTHIPDWLAEANAVSPRFIDSQDDHTVRIHALPERLITGRVRIGADADGPDIHHLAFSLDGRELISKRRPPYQVEIDVGTAPRAHSLRVDAYDAQGGLLATDEVTINSGPHRFTVRLTSPQRGATHTSSVRAVAEVEAPRHERLNRVEFFLNDTRTATLYQPPFEQPIGIDPTEPLSYVRAVAYLETGAWAEDLVFVNSRNLVEEVEVALVELYTSVTDRSGTPVAGLVESDFEVFVDGERQVLQRFDSAANQPVHAGILFDTSMSMDQRLEAAEEAALHFFELVLGPHDRACLITFNDQPELAVGFTGSKEALAGGLADLVAEGETALYDSILYSLYYFGGLRGKRALILLTDGGDSSSEYRFDDVLEFARRSQVAIYSIGIDIDRRELMFRGRLQQLCDETGGRCFFITGASELPRVYERIETEVRSQYVLVFESPEGERDAFRKVEVKLNDPRARGRRGLKVQHLPGYFQ
ncbi:MAG: VWA domain-containing protein [Holophagales bacterium]|nr:VWA domain-containing protein [Holophagales bacterium]MYH24503.1 VWA domain-containing protein [Holophagales bacterium]